MSNNYIEMLVITIALEVIMFRLNVRFLKSGMTLGKNIYTDSGKILLSAGTQLKAGYIERLNELGISDIYIETEETSDIAIDDVIREQNRFEAKKIIRQTMKNIQVGKYIPTQEIFHAVDNILDDLLNTREIMVNLSDIRSMDDYTFGHCVNVCVLSLITGIAMNYNKEQLRNLGIGAILHDIGKTAIDKELLNKPSSLTDEEYKVIQNHTVLGYKILKKYPMISGFSTMVALMHHERYDGTGYPLGKGGQAIHEFSRIVAIADVYDALTSDRVYKKKVLPHRAIEYLISMGNHQFDYEIVKKFIAHIANYPIGTIIRLNTGALAIVIDVDKDCPSRPIVRYLNNNTVDKGKKFKEIKLVDYPSITITEVLENMQ